MNDAHAPAPDTPAIVASALEKRFGQVSAVKNITLTVPRRACFGLIGANGAGKTTFIKMLLGITRPDAGSVQLLGGDPEDKRIRQRIGYLPERLLIPEAFSAERFLLGVGRMRGLRGAVLVREVERVLETVALERSAWRRRSGGYSKGMRQRTGLAAALIGSPELLILDEPTDGIDPLGRAQIRNVITDAVKAGATVFLNSHLLAESEKLCDHVAVLSQGRVIKAGPLSQLKRKDVMQARFVRTPQTHDIAVKHGFAPLPDGGDDTIGFRIEGQSEVDVSRAVKHALDDGLVLVELARELKDLETILRESIASDTNTTSTGNT